MIVSNKFEKRKTNKNQYKELKNDSMIDHLPLAVRNVSFANPGRREHALTVN